MSHQGNDGGDLNGLNLPIACKREQSEAGEGRGGMHFRRVPHYIVVSAQRIPMNERLPSPCEHCKGTGLSKGSDCNECRGKGYYLIGVGRPKAVPPPAKPQQWRSRTPNRR